MAKKSTTPKAPTELEVIAVKLDQLAAEAEALGEEVVTKSIRNAAKSARWNANIQAAKVRRAGDIIAKLKLKGLSDSEIVSQLTARK